MMILISVLVKAVLFIIVGFFLVYVFIRLMPVLLGIDLMGEIKKGNVAASVFALAVFLFMGLTIGFLLNSSI